VILNGASQSKKLMIETDKSHATLSLLLMNDSFSFAAMSTALEAF
jgi:hypothetical protein